MANDGYSFEYMEKYRGQPGKPPGQPKKDGPKRGCLATLFLTAVWLLLAGLLVGVLAFLGGYIYLSNQLEDAIAQVTDFRGTGLGGTPRFYDRNGNLLFELTTTEKRLWLAYEEIPAAIINATVAVEDDTFWTNPGFDPAAIGAALLSNVRNQDDGRPVGASTITQQLVRHVAFDYTERVSISYERKLREIFLAWIMTQRRSKQAIVQMYLNEIYYGNLAYGIEAAAQTYFGKSARDLSLAESAFLAGLPQSPVEWDPYTNFDGAKRRQEFILDLMYEDGVIDYVQTEVAKGVSIQLQPRITLAEEAASAALEAPHFVLYAQDQLERRYGADAITRGGWQITTSLDLEMQHMAQAAARDWVAQQAAHDVSNAAVVILKPGSGEILTMVGSLDYFDARIAGQVNVALSPRQPGSSIKPLTYAAAMERGWSTADVLWDTPMVLDLGGGELMRPRNYDGAFHGPVLFRDALANSYNIPPIQLLKDITIPHFIATARRMGVESLQEPPGFYGLALTLGGGEVPLLEMTHAFATLANQGQRPRLNSILRITDSRGNVIYDAQENRLPATNALDPKIAYIITDILDDDQARIPAMGADNPLALPFPAAVKTGTTNDFRDAWTIGYTPGVVVGVWLGNSDGHPMVDLPGLRGAAPLWRALMLAIYNDESMQQSLWVDGRPPLNAFIQPQGIESRLVCLPQGSGGSACSATRTDWFITGAPVHGIGRVQYNTHAAANAGAWTLATLPLPAAEGQRYVSSQPELIDGTQMPAPTECVVNSARPPDGLTPRLYLPIPPHYPDEVRARIWAQGRYRMAPPVVCPQSVIQAYRSAAPPAPFTATP